MADNEFEQRRQTVASGLAERKLDALLVSFGPNLRYLSGFTGSNGNLLVTAGRSPSCSPTRATPSRPRRKPRARCASPRGRWSPICVRAIVKAAA